MTSKPKYYGSNTSSVNKINKLKQHTIINTKLYNQTKNSNPTSFLSATSHSGVAMAPKIRTKQITSYNTNPYRSVGSSVSIDNRPKQLVVDDIENHDEKLLILKHLKVNYVFKFCFIVLFKTKTTCSLTSAVWQRGNDRRY